VSLNLVLALLLLTGLGLLLFSGGALHAIGYGLVGLVAAAELAIDRLSAAAPAPPGWIDPGGAGDREPRHPHPSRDAGHAAMPLPGSLEERGQQGD
jgi:hypothetical protein